MNAKSPLLRCFDRGRMTASNYFLPSDIQRTAEDLSPRLREQTFSAMPACRHHLPQTQPLSDSYILIWGRKNDFVSTFRACQRLYPSGTKRKIRKEMSKE